jgi:hypothetical protein
MMCFVQRIWHFETVLLIDRQPVGQPILDGQAHREPVVAECLTVS